MASRRLKPHEINASKITVDSEAGTEVVGSTKTEMTKRITARNPYETLPNLNRTIEPRPPPRFSSVLTILITMVNRMVRIWVEKNRKASRMKPRRTETVELKTVAQDGIKKEIVAFANSNGGTVYVGVDNDGNVLGVEDADGCTLQVSNMVRDAVRPDSPCSSATKRSTATGRRSNRQVNLNPSHSRQQVDFRSP